MFLKDGNLIVDITNTKDGYIKAAVINKVNKRMKLIIQKSGNILTFDLKNDGEYETFPLQYGDGTYKAYLYENVSGKSYTLKGTVWFGVTLTRMDASLLVPNQYVNYDENSPIVGIARNLCENRSEIGKYNAIYNYVTKAYRYDYVKAVLAKPGMLPDIETTYKKKMGICQDIAALATAMFRSQGVPAKFVIGFADRQSHAWADVNINGTYRLFDPTSIIQSKKIKNYTVERWY